MRIAALARGLEHSALLDDAPQVEVTDITNDSRRVTPGALYAALPGERFDGHRFIPAAIESGASAVLCESLPARRTGGVAWLHAPHARLALSELADRLFGSPSRELEVIGVTGTDGKTSTVYFIHQLLARLDGASAFLSTSGMQIGPDEKPNALHQSTPEAPEVHRALRAMRDAGARYAVLESTSHGLSRRSCRLAHVRYRAAVFTNLTHEHLEYHGSFEQYRSDKANLFRALDAGCYADAGQPDVGSHEPARGGAAVPGRATTRTGGAAVPDRATTRTGGTEGPFGVVNADDPHSAYFVAATARPVLTYGCTPGADYRAADVSLSPNGASFTLLTPGGSAACSLAIPGRFNVANALAAAAVVHALTGCDETELAAAIASLRPVHGRMSVVASEPFSLVVDYAHTPGSFENVLPFFRERTAGRLLVVFGSAGERDVGKRPIQGEIAGRYADVIVLADEDPRGEDRMQILRDIASGTTGRAEGRDLLLIPDRRLAIRRALELARPGDTVLLLGKGHETSIIGPTAAAPWDEMAVAREELARLRAGSG
ncbi:MAG: Mur ligase family protein [Spirochaetota bacterium]